MKRRVKPNHHADMDCLAGPVVIVMLPNVAMRGERINGLTHMKSSQYVNPGSAL